MPPSSGAGGFPCCVPPIRNRARSRDDDHARAGAEGIFEPNLDVADDFDFAADDVRQQISRHICNFEPARSGDASASARDLAGRDSRLHASLVDRSRQSIVCARFTHPLHFATGRPASTEYGDFIAEKAACLRAAAVNAEEKGHATILTAESAEVGQGSQSRAFNRKDCEGPQISRKRTTTISMCCRVFSAISASSAPSAVKSF